MRSSRHNEEIFRGALYWPTFYGDIGNGYNTKRNKRKPAEITQPNQIIPMPTASEAFQDHDRGVNLNSFFDKIGINSKSLMADSRHLNPSLPVCPSEFQRAFQKALLTSMHCYKWAHTRAYS